MRGVCVNTSRGVEAINYEHCFVLNDTEAET